MVLFPLIAASVALQAAASDLPAKYLAPKPKPETVIARVNGLPIRASEVDKYLWNWRAYEALQDLITYRMLQTEAKKIGLTVTDDQVEKKLQEQLKQIESALQPGTKLSQSLLEQGFPKSRLYLRTKTQMMLDGVALASFKPEEYVDVSTIIIKPKSEQATDVADAIKQAQSAFDELKKGALWDTVLKRFHTEAQIVQSHGRIGWRKLQAFPESVSKEIAGLQKGGITNPAQTTNGIQIFRIERKGKDATGDILADLKNQYLAGSKQSTLDRIRRENKVENSYFKF